MDLSVFSRDNLLAWCIVPYDARERDAAERAGMLATLGIRGEAWDWRDEHVPHLADEIEALRARDIEFAAMWVPHLLPAEGDTGLGEIDPTVCDLVHLAAERGATPQLWTCLEFGEPGPVEPLEAAAQQAAVQRAADHVAPLAQFASDRHMEVALYNHLGWAGEPATLAAICDRLAADGHTNVGIVYQQHHGHAHLDDFAHHLETMRPHLKALGLNGMETGQHWGGSKIHPYGHGEHDLALARVVAESGWRGPVSILCHTIDDAELRLRDNLEGLDWVVSTLVAERSGDLADAPPAPPSPRIPHPVWPH